MFVNFTSFLTGACLMQAMTLQWTLMHLAEQTVKYLMWVCIRVSRINAPFVLVQHLLNISLALLSSVCVKPTQAVCG